ncbi:toll/interleukin-1 receptor domain-containing protein [Streptomyces sp. NPDC001205]
MVDETPSGHPRAFLSHASEDKASFTEPLARRLAELGVYPWLDRWEMQPGDSLIQRIFTELAQASAVVVVLSSVSVQKPWVREELDSAAVRRIEEGTRLIPIRLDEVEVPAPLRHLVWVTADRDPAGIEHAAREIANTVHGFDPRPLVAPSPVYAQMKQSIYGLSKTDEFVLTLAIRAALEAGQASLLDWSVVKQQAAEVGLPAAALYESTSALAEHDYLDVHFNDEDVYRADLTNYGYNVGIHAVLPDVDEARRRVIAEIINNQPTGFRVMHDLAERANVPILVVRQLLADLQNQGLISYSLALGDATRLHNVSPTLRRKLD